MPQPASSSLTVLGGPLDGRSFPIEYTFDEFLLGSDQDCAFRLDLPGVSPIHARLLVDGASVTVRDASSASGVFVNDERVLDQATLHDGDILWLGTPGEDGSLMLRCRLVAPVAEEPSADPFFVSQGEGAPAAPLATASPKSAGAEAFFLEESFPAPSAPAPAPAAAQGADEFFVTEPGAPAPLSAAKPLAPAQPPAPALGDFALTDPVPPPPAAAPRPQPPVAAPVPVPVPGPAAARLPAPPAAPPPSPAAAPVAAPKTAPPAEAAAPRPARVQAPAGAVPRPAREGAPVRPALAGAARPRPAARGTRPTPARSMRGPLIGLGALVLLGAVGFGGFTLWQRRTTPQLASLSPLRARIGQTVVLTGSRFSPNAAENVVLFGDQPGAVVKASPERLEVTVPEVALAPGAEARLGVRVRLGSRSSAPLDLTIYQGPRLHGLSPDVAMPGDVIELSGAGWDASVKVRFGTQLAQVVDVRGDRLRVKVPEIQGPPGTAAPVTIELGDAVSNSGPFFVGHLPLLLEIKPKSAAPGEVVTLSGRGLRPASGTVGGAVGERRALVVQSSETELSLVVPRAPAGPTLVRVALNATGQVGEIAFEVKALADPIDFQFVLEPLDDDPSGEQVALSSALGPAFVLSASGGKSALQRGLEAQKRLNAAAVPLKAAREADIEARGFATGRPVIGLKGKPEVLLEVTPEDARAYTEKDWTRLGAKAKPVTPGRLATWWAAVGRDLVLLLVRGEKPALSAGLAPEGRVLQDVHAAARKLTNFGVPQAVMSEAKPPLIQALRTLGLRVPAQVVEPAESPAGAPATTAAAAKALKLDGKWAGSENVPEGARRIRVEFKGTNGTLFYEGGFSVGFPLISVQQQKGGVRFSVGVRGGVRFYQAVYDGQRLTGTISAEERGASIGSFELKPR